MFGAFLYIKGTSFDVVNSMSPSYVMDIIENIASGSRSYNVPPGTALTAQAFMDTPTYSGTKEPTITVSGTTVSWSGTSTAYKIIVWAG
ncbi:hypothetical protein [Candidatus Pantoea multigeneris]|uniref:Uncharacterized protein n=1 Tax=Candidatus Pantoea multigeneris TaxID=2608357 RepID=A0ABX0R714_9GAMM|nr:hypothetical protein [Pantoea multigeneris]NIF20569.1 hypothetical protein [Pantoea multigeneris]